MANRAEAVARGVGVQFASRALALVASVVTLSLSTRYLGITDYGLLTTAIVFVSLFEIGTDFGLGTVITRRVTARQAGGSADTGDLARLVGVSLGIKLVIGLPLTALSIVAGLVVYQGQPQAQAAVAIISAGLVLTAVAKSYDPVFMVHVRFGAASAADLSARLLGLAATATVVHLDLGLLALATVQLVTPLSRFIFTALSATRLEALRVRFDRATSLGLLREGVPFTVIIVVGILYWRADGAILSWLSTPDEVGAYGVAYTLAFNLDVISAVFAAATLSTLTRLAANRLERFDEVVRLGYRFLLLCALPIAALGVPLAKPVLAAFAGDTFVDAATPVLRLFFVGVAIGFLNQHLTNALISLHRQHFLLRLSLANLGINIVLNIVLIPQLGALGAGVAMAASQLSGLLIGAVVLQRLRPNLVPVDQLVRMVPVCALAVGAVLLVEPFGLLAQVPTGAAVVVLTALLLGAVPDEALDLVRSRLRRATTTSEPKPEDRGPPL